MGTGHADTAARDDAAALPDMCLAGPVQTDRIATGLVGRKSAYAITRRTNIAKRRAGSG